MPQPTIGMDTQTIVYTSTITHTHTMYYTHTLNIHYAVCYRRAREHIVRNGARHKIEECHVRSLAIYIH